MSSRKVVAIHQAVFQRSLDAVRIALDAGEPVDTLDRSKRTPLFYAAKDGELAIAEELIRRGADVNSCDQSLKTPLHFAAAAGHSDLIEILIKNGAKVDSQDSFGNSPLSDAVFESKGRCEIIRQLILAGADKNLKNHSRVSPLTLAESISNYNIVPCFN